jgi:hypothetical protein
MKIVIKFGQLEFLSLIFLFCHFSWCQFLSLCCLFFIPPPIHHDGTTRLPAWLLGMLFFQSGEECKPGEAHNIDDLRIFPYLLCLVIFLSYIPVVSVMFSLSLHSPHRHLVSSSLVHLRIIRWSCQFPGPTTSEAAVRRQPSTLFPHCLCHDSSS